MTDIVYGLTEEKYILDGKARTSYGIAAYANSATDGTATIVAAVYDICTDKEKLSKLIDSCNRLGLATIHLHDVVEDFLCS